MHLGFLLVEDDTDHVQLLKRSLDRLTWLSYDLIHAPDSRRAIELAQNHLLDATFVDYCLSDESGVQLIGAFRARGDRRPIVLLTSQGDEYLVAEAMRAGASDYIAKNDLNSPRLGDVVRRIANYSSHVLRQERALSEIWRRLELLTPREREVMEMMVEGKTTHEIADAMSRSDNTIKIHRSHVLRKMQAHTPAELTHMVLQTRTAELQQQY